MNIDAIFITCVIVFVLLSVLISVAYRQRQTVQARRYQAAKQNRAVHLAKIAARDEAIRKESKNS